MEPDSSGFRPSVVIVPDTGKDDVAAHGTNERQRRQATA
jgi:hypothetical protein